MLVVANGAFKSGSTWLFHVVRDMTGYGPVPTAYLNSDWKHPSILPEKLQSLLETVDLTKHHYLVKNHFDTPEQRALLLAYPDVRVLNIRRDPRDVVVSAYYHMQNFQGYEGSFEHYYWSHGRHIADKVRRYHELWSPEPGRIYVSAFERLKSAFEDECRALGTFLGIGLTDEDIAAIAESTAIDRRRRKQQTAEGRPAFFRGGRVGDWKAHLTPLMLADLERIPHEGLTPTSLGLRLRLRAQDFVNHWKNSNNT